MTPPPTRSGKRTRTHNIRIREISEDLDDDDDDGDGSNVDEPDNEQPLSGTQRRTTKKPETEEEKRKNFLERNRQGLCLFTP